LCHDLDDRSHATDLIDCVLKNAGIDTRPVYCGTASGQRRQTDEVNIGKIAPRNLLLCCQAVTKRTNEIELLFEDRLECNSRIRFVEARYRKIGAAVLEDLDDALIVVIAYENRGLRIAVAKNPNRFGKHPGGDQGQARDSDPAFAGIGIELCFGDRCFEIGQDTFSAGKQDMPGRGELDLSLGPLKQPRAQELLCLQYRLTKGRLRHVGKFRCPAKTLQTRDGHKNLQLTDGRQ
jgi:hypothetical protein